MIHTSRGTKQYFGKYRGVVYDNNDLKKLGRIRAMVPDVLGLIPSKWALPCLPMTGLVAPGQAGVSVLPPVLGNVWIEFEHGDPSKPVWTGCYWSNPSQVPLAALAGTPAAAPIVLQTLGQNTVWIGGDPATGITVSAGPAITPTSPQIKVSAAGISISDGKGGTITIIGGVVAINGLALVIK